MPAKRQSPILDELAAMYERIAARALLIAIDWAGSASNLSHLAGFGRYAGLSWQRRGRISVEGAKRLERLKGFPLTLEEMCPGKRTEPWQCPHCQHISAPHGERTACLPSFNVHSKGHREARRIQREHAARRAKNKQQTAPLEPGEPDA